MYSTILAESRLLLQIFLTTIRRNLYYRNKHITHISQFDLVPLAGAWRKLTDRDGQPVSVARCCSSRFHKQLRTALEPPPSAVISSWGLSGYKPLPYCCHQRWIFSTANVAVSWSMPNFEVLGLLLKRSVNVLLMGKKCHGIYRLEYYRFTLGRFYRGTHND
jgi:hypothetical protein